MPPHDPHRGDAARIIASLKTASEAPHDRHRILILIGGFFSRLSVRFLSETVTGLFRITSFHVAPGRYLGFGS
ncbi:MAG: hypothetical protein C0467_05965 [Planctomycetaceae bacterium]|nr:hypothetical protein [Planctomycetaceae bacterium]